jgi:hypothetical protein
MMNGKIDYPSLQFDATIVTSCDKLEPSFDFAKNGQ